MRGYALISTNDVTFVTLCPLIERKHVWYATAVHNALRDSMPQTTQHNSNTLVPYHIVRGVSRCFAQYWYSAVVRHVLVSRHQMQRFVVNYTLNVTQPA